MDPKWQFNRQGDPGSEAAASAALEIPALPPGTIHNDFSIASVKIAEGDWLVPGHKRIELDRSVPTGAPKPTDSFPSCASYAFAPPM